MSAISQEILLLAVLLRVDEQENGKIAQGLLAHDQCMFMSLVRVHRCFLPHKIARKEIKENKKKKVEQVDRILTSLKKSFCVQKGKVVSRVEHLGIRTKCTTFSFLSQR